MIAKEEGVMDFKQPVSDYMTREVEAVSRDTRLPDIARVLERWNFSSVPVVDDDDTLVGVVSRTDLLREGRFAAAGRRAVLTLPDRSAGEIMTPRPLSVSLGTPLARAARTMVVNHVHRVFVTDGDRLRGVLSTVDVVAAVRDARLDAPIATIMSAPILAVETTDPLSKALTRLEQSHVTGLIVLEHGWPVGVFTQIEALAARDLPTEAIVEDVFDQALICLPDTTRLSLAAGHAARLEVRRVIACREREAVGVVSGLDFARVVAGQA